MSTRTHATLTVNFLNYWHTGSGAGAGHSVDARCLRDQNDLPFIAGRQLKGLLRHAVQRAEAWGWLDALAKPEGVASFAELLFGSITQERGRDETTPGMLMVGNARLPDAEYDWLAQKAQAQHREQLFTELFSTAIGADGIAEDHSLRGLEVCLPIPLRAPLSLEQTALDETLRRQQHQWLASTNPWTPVEKALPLIDALGAHRSRGLGEAILSLDTRAAMEASA